MQPIDDTTWTALRDHFGIEHVMEIVFTCGLNKMVSPFHAAVRTDVDESTLDQVAHSCPVPLPPPPAGTSKAASEAR